MSLESTTIYDRRVYAQDTAPADKRDGNIWVDTSVSPPDTYVWDAATDSWEPVAPGNLTISGTAPTGVNDGHVWVDTSITPPQLKKYEADTDTWYYASHINTSNTAPAGVIDGHIWVDTSVSPATVRHWDTDTSAWYPVGRGWDLDGTVSFSNNADFSYTLNSDYDEVMLQFTDLTAEGTTSEGIAIQINGVTTADYHTVHQDGTASKSGSQWYVFLAHAGRVPDVGEITLTGRWTGKPGIQNFVRGYYGAAAESGVCVSATSPLTDFRIFNADGTTGITGTLEVYGRAI